MKKVLFVVLACAGLASAAAAAEIHGTISEGGKPLPQGVAVKLDCGGTSASGTTDAYGSYSVKTSATGECRLTLDYKGASPSLSVTVYEKPSKYDLVVKESGGKLTLARN
jgi:hypothetical protein